MKSMILRHLESI